MRAFTKRFLSLGVAPLAALALVAPGGASAHTRALGAAGWQVQSSATANQSGEQISSPGFDAHSWLSVANDDGNAPGTEIEALVQNGGCPDVYYSTNLKDCFGYTDTVGPVTVPRFAVPWWYRTTFTAGQRPTAQLIVNGIVGEADVFLNGHELATHATVQGDFARYTIDAARWLRPGRNAVALRVYPNNPQTMFTLDNVDWMQIAPDNDTGIQFPVQLHTGGAVSLTDAHVVQDDAPDLSSASLTVKGVVSNSAATTQVADVSARIAGPHGASPIEVHTSVSLAAHSSQTVVLDPSSSPALQIAHPAVWWPYQMGAQPLYRLRMSASDAHGGPTDTQRRQFGIRTITTRLVGASPIAPDGSRQFLVNGRPFVFRGGGWSEDLLLHYSARDTANQIALIKNLGLNGIRIEGHEMPNRFYRQMDRAGILIDAGYQCCDAWQLQDSKLTSAHDYDVLRRSAETIGEHLRDHPSVLSFGWSDDKPTAEQEQVTLHAFAAADFQDPVIASAEYKSTPTLGSSGEKEGPYDWVPPSYWYDTSHYDPGDGSRTNVGGAWAFDSEASAGDTIPTLDSLRRFLSPAELDKLWQDPDYNQYHLNYEDQLPNKQQNYGYAFGTLHDLDQAISARYGPWTSLEQYVEEAQLQNYETQRAEFEAYIAHSTNAAAPSTGIVYWQLNKGWPTLLWDLYNNDYDQAGSYYGAQEANRHLHAFYAYDTGTVGIDNLGARTVSGLSVHAKVFSVDGKRLWHGHAGGLSLDSQGVASGVLDPTVPAQTAPPTPATTYFVQLVLRRHHHVVDRNTYWMSTQPDQVDWNKTIGLPQATMTSYADLTGLRSLPAGQVQVQSTSVARHGAGHTDRVARIRITNPATSGAVAFFLHADVRRGTAAGAPAGGDDELLPVFFNRNDTTLLPGQSETVRVRYSTAQLQGASPVITVTGDNVATVAVPAG